MCEDARYADVEALFFEFGEELRQVPLLASQSVHPAVDLDMDWVVVRVGMADGLDEVAQRYETVYFGFETVGDHLGETVRVGIQHDDRECYSAPAEGVSLVGECHRKHVDTLVLEDVCNLVAAVSVCLLFMLATLLPQKLCAQQDPAFLHYWSLAPQYNPAAVGRNPQLCINGAYQAHASGFEDAGGTMYAGADMAFRLGNTLHGIGAVFQNDEFGLFSHQRFSVQYAYRFKLFGGQLAVGVEADMLN